MTENEKTIFELNEQLGRLDERLKSIEKLLGGFDNKLNGLMTKELCDSKQKTQWYKTIALILGSGGSGGVAGYLTGLLF